jgi:thioredoxin reductase (NADPH)
METEYVETTGIERVGEKWLVKTSGEDTFLAKALIVTAGAEYNKLGIPGEERLTGKGVSYCATCDAAFFKGMDVAVVGGGDAAMDEGLFTTRYADKVSVVHRRDELRASAILQQRAFANPKMDFVWNTVVDEVVGEDQVTSVVLRDVVTGTTRTLPLSALFIFIGQHPNSGILDGLVEMDAGKHVIVDEWMRTTQPGLFAAGDIRQNSARQVASSVGDGVTAAIAADHYITDTFQHEAATPAAAS